MAISRKMKFCASILACAAALGLIIQSFTANAGDKATVVSPKDDVIKLFDGKSLDGLYTWIRDTKYEDPRNVFTVHDGLLHISGDGFGGATTKNEYANYHLVIEFKWGEITWEPRKENTRDSGVLVHCTGEDGSYSGTWMNSIEAQIIEGGVGDILAVRGTDPDGKPMPCSLTAEIALDRDGEMIWKKGGEKKTIEGGRINWYGRDPDWKDVIGFRGKEDVESPFGEWTRMDVICEKDTIKIFVNGTQVNEATELTPSAGKIIVQTEGAEMFVRKWELWPIGKGPKPAKAKQD
ncbi:MAG: DUF1080 domain-containing protein [Planctomycetaceae bacterium]